MTRHDTLMEGCRVLDLAEDGCCLAGKILGDMGADVIKIEPPGGSPTRNKGPFHKDIPDPERSLFWFATNLHKRGITLNLETAEGRAIFKRLVEASDIVIEGFAPGYMEGLGLGYRDLERVNPGIVMTSITPFGQSGPYAHYKGSDIVGVAMGGMQRLFGDPDRAPVRISQPEFFLFGGLHGALGSLMAFYHRAMSGEGQHVDVSCQQGIVLALMITSEIWDILHINYRGRAIEMMSIRPPDAPPLRLPLVWPCKDGYVLFMIGGGELGAARSSKNMVELANEHGYALELTDYDWIGSWDTRTMDQEQFDRVMNPIAEFMLTQTKMELFEAAARPDKEFRLAPMNTVKDVLEFPQFLHRGFFVQVEHPELGETLTYPGFPIKMWGPGQEPVAPYRVQRRAPLLGEHNSEVYEKRLGMSPEELVLLKNHGVI
ncbi:MAG: CoA transferase [Chloroflexota bacterium]|nr:CoA transferase [Chloroflexota bacterium]